MRPFQNRKQAGQLLSERLMSFKLLNPIVLAVPRGGVPVAVEVAKRLNAPLDFLMVKKIGAPRNPEMAVGAVSENSEPYFNESLIESLHIDRKVLHRIAKQKVIDLRNQLHKFRGSSAPLDVQNRMVLLIDDGIATGTTLLTAIEFLRHKKPSRIVVATPVAARESIHELQAVADDVICLFAPEDLQAVGFWYEDFDQVSDEEVIQSLHDFSMATTGRPSDEVVIRRNNLELRGQLLDVPHSKACIVFVTGKPRKYLSPMNRYLAQYLNKQGMSTLLISLLTEAELTSSSEEVDFATLASRLVLVMDWLHKYLEPQHTPMALIAVDSGATLAFNVLGMISQPIFGLVSCGRFTKPPQELLRQVHIPTLIIIAGQDDRGLSIGEQTEKEMPSCKMIQIFGVDSDFQSEGALDELATEASSWLHRHLPFEQKPNLEVY